MADCSLSSWSESASTLQHRRSNSGYSSSQYSSYSEPDKPTENLVSISDAPWVISYLLESNPLNELPLRVMFSFNSGRALPSLREAHKYWHYGKEGQKIIQFLASLEKITPMISDAQAHELVNPAEAFTNLTDPHCPYDRFMDPGNENLLKVDLVGDFVSPDRRASQGLPPNVVHKLLLSNVFRADFSDVDFHQALTGLDYLRDLEETRRCSQREAAGRLGITFENWRDVLSGDRSALDWVEKILENETIIEGYFARISVNLRIWTMVNELKQPQFYKPNVLAMLNTLFPPSVGELPNKRVLASVIHGHRASLYHILIDIESGNRKAVEAFVAKHLRIGTSYSWPETRLQLEKYLELAESMISHARLMTGIDSIPQIPERSPDRSKNSTQNKSNPRQSPFMTPHSSVDGKNSVFGTPRFSSSTSLFRHAQSRSLSRNIIIREPNLDEPKPMRSAPLPDRTPKVCRPTLSTPGTAFSGRCGSTPLVPTQQISPAKQVSFTSQRSDPFDTRLSGYGSLTASSYSEAENLMSGPPSTMRTSNEYLELKHKRTNSSGKAKLSNSTKVSLELRPHLRRDSSALRNVESVEDCAAADELAFLSRPYEDNPPQTPNVDPHKLDPRPSLGESLVRKVKSTNFVRNTAPSIIGSDFIPSPILTRQSSVNFNEMDSRHGSLPKSSTRSRNDTYSRNSMTPRRSSTTRGNNPLGILFGTSTDTFMTYRPENLVKVITPLEVQDNFTGIKSESSRRITPILHQKSSFAHLREQPTSPVVLGFLEQYSGPPTPKPVALDQPFKKYCVPDREDDIETLMNPELKKQRSTSFLEMRRSKSGFGANRTPKFISPTPYVPTSEFAMGSPFIGIDAAMKTKLKKKSSMPTIGFLSKKPKAIEDGLRIYETNDPNERLIMTQPNISTRSFTLRGVFSPTQSKPSTPTTVKSPNLTTPAQRLHLIKSQASLRATDGMSTTPKSHLKPPTRSLFRKFSREQILTSADITEPFPDALRQSLSSTTKGKHSKNHDVPTAIAGPDIPYAPGGTRPLTKDYIPPTTETLEDFTSKEYTRRWFLEESRARRYELDGPEGSPMKSEREMKRLRKQGMVWPRVRRRGVEIPSGERKKGVLDGLFRVAGGWGRKEEKSGWY